MFAVHRVVWQNQWQTVDKPSLFLLFHFILQAHVMPVDQGRPASWSLPLAGGGVCELKVCFLRRSIISLRPSGL